MRRLIKKNPAQSVEPAKPAKPEQKFQTWLQNDRKTANLLAMIRASQAISSEIDFDKLLLMLAAIMIENVGADRAYLILESDGELKVEACGSKQEGNTIRKPPIPYTDEKLSAAIVAKAAAEQKIIILDEACKDKDYKNDPHIQSLQIKSILCVPILHKKRMIGIFYLENNLETAVFTSLHLEMLKIISDQIAIAIDNARLFDKIKQAEKKYRDIFENAVEGIFQVSHNGSIISINPSFARTMGYDSREDAIKNIKTVQEDLYVNPEQRQKFSQLLQENGVVNGFEAEFYRKDRSRIWISMHARPVYDRQGKLEYVEGIITDITKQRRFHEKLLESERTLRRENILLRSNIKDRYKFSNIIGKSPVMQNIYELILNAATSNAGVVIYGESGTGKELVARAIHDNSRRRDADFVAVNCGAIPQNLFESEFFGYKKGAFTGAVRDKNGFLKQADGGTLFLDEIGELDLNGQIKLLRVLEGGGYIPLGGSRAEHPDVRIIAATNRNLQEQVKQGRLRKDFFYRIHIIPISLPPLRERKEDIPLLIEFFLKKFGSNENEAPAPLPLKTQKALYNYHWPGNIRELQNTVHRYISLGKLDFMETPIPLRENQDEQSGKLRELPADNPEMDYKTLIAQFEKKLFLRALEKHQWHRERAAASLGLTRRTFFRKLARAGLNKTA